jgi:hypothetical protein
MKTLQNKTNNTHSKPLIIPNQNSNLNLNLNLKDDIKPLTLLTIGNILINNSSISSNKNKNIIINNNLIIGQMVTTINSNLMVCNDQTIIKTNNLSISDCSPSIGTYNSDPNLIKGIKFLWSNDKIGFFGFNPSTYNFSFVPDMNTNNVGNIECDNIKYKKETISNIHINNILDSSSNITEIIDETNYKRLYIYTGNNTIIYNLNLNLEIGTIITFKNLGFSTAQIIIKNENENNISILNINESITLILTELPQFLPTNINQIIGNQWISI